MRQVQLDGMGGQEGLGWMGWAGQDWLNVMHKTSWVRQVQLNRIDETSWERVGSKSKGCRWWVIKGVEMGSRGSRWQRG